MSGKAEQAARRGPLSTPARAADLGSPADALAERLRRAAGRDPMGPQEKLKHIISEVEQRDLADEVGYAEGSIVSKTISENDVRTITLFAFDKGQALSEHSVPFDAFVQVLDGEAELVIDGKPVRAAPGGFITIPAGVPHAVRAVKRFKMILVMLRVDRS